MNPFAEKKNAKTQRLKGAKGNDFLASWRLRAFALKRGRLLCLETGKGG
jgi:hypothetical protein